ncbi:hypothetical protein GYMLUDRAFT_74756 [Collybiopsis luxurians FD-317 M1]|uniref:Pre-mRNA-splicing factor 38 n=1 Tax=Collybiopsis luxurians FD-317 M1 TaxID=944289 RepID=A0A0D0CKP8_9AGAR|nr:hypothetical protein GYMLUDRAFT_74756 [Collybiopsis luxurians FD-317 M1]
MFIRFTALTMRHFLLECLGTSAWHPIDQENSDANARISIPTDDFSGSTGAIPSGPEALRRSRSRSPEEADNPGNNVHVSGLSHKVDSRDLETSTEEAEVSITAHNGAELMGKVITIAKPYDSRYSRDFPDCRGGRYDDYRDRDRDRRWDDKDRDRDYYRERKCECGDRYDRYDRHDDRCDRYDDRSRRLSWVV